MIAWLRFAFFGFVLFVPSARAQGSSAPEAFAERWVVVLGSYASANAASQGAAARGAGLHILRSDLFTGLAPGYHVLVAGPFPSRADAATAGGTVAAAARGYIKYTGALRHSQTAEAGEGAQRAKATADRHALKVASFLSEEQRLELEHWRRAAERSAGPHAHYEILQVFASLTGAPSAVVIRERIASKGSCLQGYRELQFGPPQAGIAVRTTSVLGQNCCAGMPCPERTPGGLMLELFEGSRDVSWAIDPERGVALDNLQGWQKRITRAERSELEALRAFDPRRDTFECSAGFSGGVAHCFKYAAGKGYDFVWAERPGGPVLERIIIAHRQ